MKARLQLGLMRLVDPRLVRLMVIAVMLAFLLMANTAGVQAATCPGGSHSGQASGCG